MAPVADNRESCGDASLCRFSDWLMMGWVFSRENCWRTLVWRCLHWKQPFRDFVCVFRFATRGSAMVTAPYKAFDWDGEKKWAMEHRKTKHSYEV